MEGEGVQKGGRGGEQYLVQPLLILGKPPRASCCSLSPQRCPTFPERKAICGPTLLLGCYRYYL